MIPEIPKEEYVEVARLFELLDKLEKKKQPTYFGDQYLTMQDLFEEFTPEIRFLFFGGALTDSQINLIYGRFDSVALSLKYVLKEYMEGKERMVKVGINIKDQILKGVKRPTDHQIYS